MPVSPSTVRLELAGARTVPTKRGVSGGLEAHPGPPPLKRSTSENDQHECRVLVHSSVSSHHDQLNDGHAPTHRDDHADHVEHSAALRPSGVRGNPGPLGLLCFGMTTVMLMFIETSWSDKAFMPTVIAYAAFYGGLGQFVAGILELIKGNTFAGTAFASYGCFWMGWFLLEFLSTIDPGMPFSTTGKTLWLALWGVLTAGFFVVTLRKNFGLMCIFSSLTVTFFLLAGGVHSPEAKTAGGYVGFACGLSAIYTALAMLYQDELGIRLPGIAPVHFI
ncbi:hypothetical protein FOA52_014954 [Chlamydomonas sp. UWO 241]|nr:hypothetical protein FOA52_014954 [Chlamydomonas sp. UWO 241]